MYRVGFPGWKVAGRLWVPLRVRVFAHFDNESKTYWASSPDLDGLVVSGATLDELRSETLSAAQTLLELEVDGSNKRAVTTDLRVMDAIACSA